jgi:large subunit ribosomal protein L1
MVDRDTILEAVESALEDSAPREFEQSVDLAINLRNVDLSDPQNRIEEEVVLPRGRGRQAKVGVFAEGEVALNAEGVADLVVEPDEIEELSEDGREARNVAKEHEFFVAEAPLMPTIGRTLGPVLGPRGKMPNPLEPGDEVVPVVENLRDSVRLRSQEDRTFHCKVGMESMDAEDLADNVGAVLRRITRNFDRGELHLDRVFVKTTMGPSKRMT